MVIGRDFRFVVCTALLAAVCCCAAGAVPEDAEAPVAASRKPTHDIQGPTQAGGVQPEQSLAEQQYRRALELRDMQDASQRELRRAVKLLYSAAGIRHLSMERPAQQAQQHGEGALSTATGQVEGGQAGSPRAGQPAGKQAQQAQQAAQQVAQQAQQGSPEFLTAAAVRLELRNDTPPHVGALKELVYVYREGDGVPVNPAIAHRLLLLLAELGQAEAQADVAFHLALGIEPVAPNSRDQLFRLVTPDVPAALVHYTFAAHAGEPVAQMSLGYRHLMGIDVPRSCQTASLYYAPVAEKVLQQAQMRDGLPDIEPIKLSYQTAHSRRGLTSEQEMLHYQWFADFGNIDAAREAAKLMANGDAADMEQAVKYLTQAADAGDSDAMAHLGNMYANGHGVPQDNKTAMNWFWQAADRGNPGGYLGLGYMHLAAHGVSEDHAKALNYLNAAVGQPGSYGRMSQRMLDMRSSAQFFLGLMHLRGWGTAASVKLAAQHWESAGKAGHLLAAYNLAMLHLGGQTEPKGGACPAAVALLKGVAEKGFPAQQEANGDFQSGDYEWALLNFLKAAEMGVEAGQSNAAWMLTEGYGYEGGAEAGRAALLLYKRSAQQGNNGALLRIGDSYWYGKGVARDWKRAAQMYHEAGRHSSAQALFNQGYMHQYGAGLPRDFHLAKRYFDDCLKKRPETQLPVTIALHYLRLHQWWEGVRGRLPPRWAALITATLFSVTQRGPAMHAAAHHSSPARAHGLAAWAGSLRRLLTFDFLFDSLDGLFEQEGGPAGDSNVDLTVALGLLLMLALVLWRRRALRLQNQARQFVQAGVPAAVPHWVQEQQRAQQAPAPAPPAVPAVPAAPTAVPAPALPADQPGSSSAGASGSGSGNGSGSGRMAQSNGPLQQQAQQGQQPGEAERPAGAGS